MPVNILKKTYKHYSPPHNAQDITLNINWPKRCVGHQRRRLPKGQDSLWRNTKQSQSLLQLIVIPWLKKSKRNWRSWKQLWVNKFQCPSYIYVRKLQHDVSKLLSCFFAVQAVESVLYPEIIILSEFVTIFECWRHKDLLWGPWVCPRNILKFRVLEIKCHSLHSDGNF